MTIQQRQGKYYVEKHSFSTMNEALAYVWGRRRKCRKA